MAAISLHLLTLLVRWDPSPRESMVDYEVYYKKEKSGPPYRGVGANEAPSSINVGKTTSFNLAGLDAAETYYVTVRCHDTPGHKCSYPSEVIITPRWSKTGSRVKRTGSASDIFSHRNPNLATEHSTFSAEVPKGRIIDLSHGEDGKGWKRCSCRWSSL
jgi:hypothetical protein